MFSAAPAVLPDTVLEARGLPKRCAWTPPQWLAFLAGWSFDRLAFPDLRHEESGRAFFDFGRVEAKHFAPAGAPS
jgi:hypothetical protein